MARHPLGRCRDTLSKHWRLIRSRRHDDDGRAGDDLIQFDAFHDLLPALAGSLDIGDVFQHLSAVASRILPHDKGNLALATDDSTQFRAPLEPGRHEHI